MATTDSPPGARNTDYAQALALAGLLAGASLSLSRLYAGNAWLLPTWLTMGARPRPGRPAAAPWRRPAAVAARHGRRVRGRRRDPRSSRARSCWSSPPAGPCPRWRRPPRPPWPRSASRPAPVQVTTEFVPAHLRRRLGGGDRRRQARLPGPPAPAGPGARPRPVRLSGRHPALQPGLVQRPGSCSGRPGSLLFEAGPGWPPGAAGCRAPAAGLAPAGGCRDPGRPDRPLAGPGRRAVRPDACPGCCPATASSRWSTSGTAPAPTPGWPSTRSSRAADPADRPGRRPHVPGPGTQRERWRLMVYDRFDGTDFAPSSDPRSNLVAFEGPLAGEQDPDLPVTQVAGGRDPGAGVVLAAGDHHPGQVDAGRRVLANQRFASLTINQRLRQGSTTRSSPRSPRSTRPTWPARSTTGTTPACGRTWRPAAWTRRWSSRPTRWSRPRTPTPPSRRPWPSGLPAQQGVPLQPERALPRGRRQPAAAVLTRGPGGLLRAEFAIAMAMMARQVGVPSRVAVGFTSG